MALHGAGSDGMPPGMHGTHQPVHSAPVRVAFFGMAGQFSLLALEELLRADVEVAAVVLPALRGRAGRPSPLPLVQRQSTSPRGVALPMFATGGPRTILDVAAERAIPALELGGKGALNVSVRLAGLAPDAITVACFSQRLPAPLLRLPRLGCLNVHPSLLPRHRGPDPLFWTFHDGDETGGVTIHLMDEGYDTGPILLSERIPLPDGMDEGTLERLCATRGGALLADALARLNAGTLRPQTQDASRATYESWPTEDDYVITPTWSARRAYRFLMGVGGRGEPARFAADDTPAFVLGKPLGYDADATLGVPWRLDGDTLAAQCMPGVLRCQIAS